LTPAGTTFDGTLDPGTFPPGTYHYVVPGTTPCPNDTAQLAIAIPQAVNAGLDSTITLCRDAAPFSMRAMLAGTPDATGTWADVSGTTVPDLFDPATGAIGVYTYTVPATLPCPAQSAVLTINLDALPQAGLDDSLVICANGGNTPLFPLLGGTPDQGGHWLAPDSTILPDGILDPSLQLSGIYRYVSIGPGTCAHLSDTALVAVQVNPLPPIAFTADPDSGCAPLEVTFTNTTDPAFVGGFCQWDVGDGSAPIDTCTSFTHTFDNPGWYHVKLTVTTPQGCTDQLIAPGTVLVDPKPQATFSFTPSPVTAGNNHVVFTATDPHAVQHFWMLPDHSQPSGAQVEYTFPDELAGAYPVCLSVYDRYSCADTLCDTIPVYVANLWVPNAFTPDGNGNNDVFHVVTTDMAPEDYNLRIFDRWGHLVFESSDPAQGWDGGNKNGGKCPTGVYVWQVEYRPLFTSDKLTRTGTVTLTK
jgi:gliding motility-associated-like protein